MDSDGSEMPVLNSPRSEGGILRCRPLTNELDTLIEAFPEFSHSMPEPRRVATPESSTRNMKEQPPGMLVIETGRLREPGSVPSTSERE